MGMRDNDEEIPWKDLLKNMKQLFEAVSFESSWLQKSKKIERQELVSLAPHERGADYSQLSNQTKSGSTLLEPPVWLIWLHSLFSHSTQQLEC